MTAAAEKPRKILTISELNLTVRRMFEAELPSLWIQGEISNMARPASGHWYFSLKDDQAQIRCAMFRRANTQISRTGFHPDNGDQVLLKGRVSLYEPRGDYQFIAELMEEAGSGALQRTYEQLKTKLQAEGLFSAKKKKPLPQIPRCIGVITSATGAALQDIVNVLARRMPMTPVVVYPVLVQGEMAATDITNALLRAEQEQRCDVLIIGRGGGSLEDLWAFNDETLARQAFASSIPIISAVGHEIDFTILDFVADLRAPTPSAAAELATPVTDNELAGQLLYMQERMQTLLQQKLKEHTQRVAWLQKRLQLAHPGQWLQQQQQKLDFQIHKLDQLIQRRLDSAAQNLEQLQSGLSIQYFLDRISQNRQSLAYFLQTLQTRVEHKLDSQKHVLAGTVKHLNALSPLATLERGYAVVQEKAGKVVTSTSQLKIGDKVTTSLQDGTIKSEILSIHRK